MSDSVWAIPSPAVHPRPESAIQINDTEVKTARARVEPPRKTKDSQAPSPSASRNLAANAPVHTMNNGAGVAKRKAAIKVARWCSVEYLMISVAEASSVGGVGARAKATPN